jgi:hypothetical protein
MKSWLILIVCLVVAWMCVIVVSAITQHTPTGPPLGPDTIQHLSQGDYR